MYISFCPALVLVLSLFFLTACGASLGDRAITGGAIGAATGAAAGLVVGPLGIGTGAMIGAAVGAGTGLVTSVGQVNLGRPIYK